MYKIATLNKISPKGLAKLDAAKYAVIEDLDIADGILVRSFKMHDMEFAPSLKAIARAGAGVNNIPLDRCAEEGIVVFNTPGANANAVKELVLCALFMASRDVKGGMEWLQGLEDTPDFLRQVEKGKSAFIGPEISGKKLGVIGLGAIGVLVANAAVKLGMEVYGYDPYISVNSAWALSKWVRHVTNLNELLGECDYITLHLPYNDKTGNIINEESISLMKNGVRLLNLARGELVEEEALLKALEEKKIARYVTDFGSYRLMKRSDCVCFPHLGASTPESEENCAAMAVKELRDYLENGNTVNSVNLPSIAEPRTTSHRICIIHRNVPNMLGQLTGVIGANNINIENLANRARGDIAYTMIDTNSEVSDTAFAHVENIIRVRIINS